MIVEFDGEELALVKRMLVLMVRAAKAEAREMAYQPGGPRAWELREIRAKRELARRMLAKLQGPSQAGSAGAK